MAAKAGAVEMAVKRLGFFDRYFQHVRVSSVTARLSDV